MVSEGEDNAELPMQSISFRGSGVFFLDELHFRGKRGLPAEKLVLYLEYGRGYVGYPQDVTRA